MGIKLMGEDTTYVVEAEVQIKGDTVLYQIDKTDIKLLYEEAFGQLINQDNVADHLYLFFTYIPLSIIFILILTFVNIRWNKTYNRLKKAEEFADLSKESIKIMKKLDFQQYQILDRIFVFGVVWIIAATADILLIVNNLTNVTWFAFLALIYTSQRILQRLVAGSALKGINDTDLIKGFNYYIKRVLVNSISDRLKALINIDIEGDGKAKKDNKE